MDLDDCIHSSFVTGVIIIFINIKFCNEVNYCFPLFLLHLLSPAEHFGNSKDYDKEAISRLVYALAWKRVAYKNGWSIGVYVCTQLDHSKAED